MFGRRYGMRGAAEVTKYLQKGGCRDDLSKDSKKGQYG